MIRNALNKAGLLAVLGTLGALVTVQAESNLVIGTGSVAGVYYPTGGAICRFYEREASADERCNVEATGGSIDNLTGLREGRYSLVVVANNLYGESHMPYPDTVEGGVLGVGRAPVLSPAANLKLIADLAVGEWRRNEDFDMHPARSVVLHFPRLKRGKHATIDGELISLKETVELQIHPGALKVLKP